MTSNNTLVYHVARIGGVILWSYNPETQYPEQFEFVRTCVHSLEAQGARDPSSALLYFLKDAGYGCAFDTPPGSTDTREYLGIEWIRIDFYADPRADAPATEAKPEIHSILHVTVGIPGQWEPTDKELEDVKSLFQSSINDPKGAVVATRTGIVANVISMSGDTPDIEVTRATVPVPAAIETVPAEEHMVLSVDATDEDLERIATKLGVTVEMLRDAAITDTYDRRLSAVQTVDLLTADAVLHVRTFDYNPTGIKPCACSCSAAVVNTSMDRERFNAIKATANLTGCYLTFPTPLGNQLGKKPIRIPVTDYLRKHDKQKNSEASAN